MKSLICKNCLLAALFVFGIVPLLPSSHAGELDPNAPPGSTMHTLEELYQVNKNLSHPAGFVAAQSGMVGAYEGFLQIDGIPGESDDPNHSDWIEVLSYHLGITMDTEGGTHPDPEFTEVTVVKRIDKASPYLALHCAQGQGIPTATIEFCRATGDNSVYFRVTLEGVYVAEVNTMIIPLGGADLVPMEEISFTCQAITWEYIGLDATGDPLPPVQTGWDLETGQPR